MKFGTMFKNYEQGEIVVVPFPFSDLSNVKQRPVLILSKSMDNKKFDDLITCGITSNLKFVPHSVLIDNNDLETGKIPAKSVIKVDKLFTLNKNVIRKKIAKLNENVFLEVKKEFFNLI
jgi:mRNA interferase MazF